MEMFPRTTLAFMEIGLSEEVYFRLNYHNVSKKEIKSSICPFVSFRDELLSERTEAERRVVALERREQELQQLIQQVSEDFQKVSTWYP